MRQGFLLFSCMFFFIVTASGNIDSIDATTHMYLAKQIIQERRIDFGKGKLADQMVAHENPQNHNRYILYNFGYALFLVPGVLLSDGIRSLMHAAPSSFPSQYDWIYIWYADALNAITITLLLFCIYKITILVAPSLSEKKWLPLVLAASLFATNMVIQGHHHFAHPLFTLFTSLSFIAVYKYVKNRALKYLGIFSLCFTIAASMYNATFVLFVIPFMALLLSLSLPRERIKNIVYLLLALIPSVAIQLGWNYMRFENILFSGYTEMGFKLFEVNPVENVKHFIAMTLGPNLGLLFNNPILIISYILAIRSLFSKKRLLRSYSLFFLVLSGCYLINYSLASIWHGESTYGPRYLFPLVPFGIVLFLLYASEIKTKFQATLILCLLSMGIFIQIPGLLIPHFTFPLISKPFCIQPQYRYFDLRCSPAVVGWAHLIKREIKTSALIFKNGPLITDRYPNPLISFKTIYPDPFFDVFSKYKTSRYKVSEDLLNNIYAFSPDIWWIKLQYYKNIVP